MVLESKERRGGNKLNLLNEALYLLTQKYTDHAYKQNKIFKSRFAKKKVAENEHFSQKAKKKQIDLSYFERKFENRVYDHMVIEKKKLNVSKTKPVVPRGHPLLLLLFYQSKSCMHNKVGTCTEILPILI